MSLKLKDFITNLRACKTNDEEKQLLLNEKAAIRQSFIKNQQHLKPRNLIKLVFINLQGHDTEFGQVESLNIACKNSFIEKKVGYLTMSIFLHDKSEMIMMATNRIGRDMEHPNLYVQGLALSTFTSIADSDMAAQIYPKVLNILQQKKSETGMLNLWTSHEEPQKKVNVLKKALLAAYRILQKCPQFQEEFILIFDKIFKEKDHGIWISALPLYDLLFQKFVNDNQKRQKLLNYFPFLIEKIQSLMTHLDPEYTVNGVNDPFLMIKLLNSINKILNSCQKVNYQIPKQMITKVEKMIVYSMSLYKPDKKTVNAVLYELARLALFFKNSEQLTSCGFHILNQLMETQVSSSNFKFVSLNLLKNFENYSENALKMLDTHCALVLEILQKDDEDDSLQFLALKVLSKITSSSNLSTNIETLKNLLLKKRETNQEMNFKDEKKFSKQIVSNILYMLEHKIKDDPLKRVKECIKLMLIIEIDIEENDFASLVNLIGLNEEIQQKVLQDLWQNFPQNWAQDSYFKLSVYCFGEYSQLIEQNDLGFTLQTIVEQLYQIYQRIKNSQSILYLINSITKIMAKSNSINQQDTQKIIQILNYYSSNQNSEIQNRSNTFKLILENNQLTKEEKQEIFQEIPIFAIKEKTEQIIDTPIQNNFEPEQNPQSLISQKQIQKIILTDQEIQISLKYQQLSPLEISGELVVENKTSQIFYDLTGLLIGINCPSLNFVAEKKSELLSHQDTKWNFNINLPNFDQKSFKIKYVVRYFYNKDLNSEDYRQSKEGIYDFDIVQDENIQSLNIQENDTVDFLGGFNKQKEENNTEDLLELDLIQQKIIQIFILFFSASFEECFYSQFSFNFSLIKFKASFDDSSPLLLVSSSQLDNSSYYSSLYQAFY